MTLNQGVDRHRRRRRLELNIRIFYLITLNEYISIAISKTFLMIWTKFRKDFLDNIIFKGFIKKKEHDFTKKIKRNSG